jgi:SAM-dependent methyltransferase
VTRKNLLLFGAGNVGKWVLDVLSQIDDICVVGFVDNDKAKQGGMAHGLPVFAPVEAIAKDDCDIYISVTNPMPVAEQLRAIGYNRFNSGLSALKSLGVSKIYSYEGVCPICENDVFFSSLNSWFRDCLVCESCGGAARERALMVAIEEFSPNWKNYAIHESSPLIRGASKKLMTAPGYIGSQFYPNHKPGEIIDGFRNEDLTSMTFADNSIDLHVTQDVLEHVFDIDSAFTEIARTLRPGGMHIFTVPLVNGIKATVGRARLNKKGSIEYLFDPIYHSDPVSEKGALVVWDWGMDIVSRIFEASKMPTIVMRIDDATKGIKGKFVDVLISIKC